MNHREPPHLSVALSKALRCLVLGLLPAMALPSAHALPRLLLSLTAARRATDPIPYLPAMGAPALRFQEAAAPAEANLGAVPATTAVTAAPPAAAPDVAPASSAETVAAPSAPAAKPAPETPAGASKTPAPILPDDARPTIHPEDFLPYFQIPGTGRQPEDVTLLVPAPKAAPAPAPIPASSATYTQSSK